MLLDGNIFRWKVFVSLFGFFWKGRSSGGTSLSTLLLGVGWGTSDVGDGLFAVSSAVTFGGWHISVIYACDNSRIISVTIFISSLLRL